MTELTEDRFWRELENITGYPVEKSGTGRCIFPENHRHNDADPSAYYGIYNGWPWGRCNVGCDDPLFKPKPGCSHEPGNLNKSLQDEFRKRGYTLGDPEDESKAKPNGSKYNVKGEWLSEPVVPPGWDNYMVFADGLKHPEFGLSPIKIWEYRRPDKHGQNKLVCCVARYLLDDGARFFAKWSVIRHSQSQTLKWAIALPKGPWPIYNLQELLEHPDKPVIIFEGEKAAEAGKNRFPEYVCIAFLDGCMSFPNTDWLPLRGRKVWLFPDNDEPGRKAWFELAAHLIDDVAECWAVKVPRASLPDGWDVADDLPESCQNLDLDALLTNASLMEKEETEEGSSGYKIKSSSVANLERAIRGHPDLQGLVAYDTFLWQKLLLKQIPDAPSEEKLPRPWQDIDTINLLIWFQNQKVQNVTEGAVNKAVEAAAYRNRFNSARLLFDALPKWDNVLRMDQFFFDTCKVRLPDELKDLSENDPKVVEWERWLKLCARILFMSIIERVYNPGSKVECMIILEGPQGLLKSTLLRVLALNEDLFSDNLPHDLNHNNAKDHLPGKLIIEMRELQQFKVSDAEGLKGWLSTQVDKFRRVWGRHEVNRPRQSVFVGSTNLDDYFIDDTGNRRFFPLWCEKIDIDKAKAEIYQIYAEAKHRHQIKENYQWWPSPEEEELAKPEQAARVPEDPWEERVIYFLKSMAVRALEEDELKAKNKLETFDITKSTFDVTNGEMLEKLNVEVSKQRRTDGMRMGRLLKKLKGIKSKVYRGHLQHRGYVYKTPDWIETQNYQPDLPLGQNVVQIKRNQGDT